MSITPFLSSEIASHIACCCPSMFSAHSTRRMSGLFCSEVFFGQSWAFRGKRRETAQSIRPEEVLDSFDAIVNLGSSPSVGQSFQRLSKMAEMCPRITQSLDDHCHRPTLERIDRRRHLQRWCFQNGKHM